MNNTGIGALVSTTSKIKTAAHGAANLAPPLVLARGAFLGLIRLNVWGLATLLSKKAFEVNKATTDAQPNGKKWWDIQAKFRIAWWNVGGNWDKFLSAVNAGKNKKALGFKLAPSGIKAKLKAQGIGSYSALGSYNQGIGEPATIATTAAAASAIYLALKPIIDDLFDKFKSDVPADFLDEFEEPKTGADASDTGSSLMSGSGTLIGVAALAAIYFGTMSKK
jgi:hypothetical protein